MYPIPARIGAEHFVEFVCTLTKGKKSPGEELQGEGIDWVLFPEGLEQLQEAPSASPGKLDITRLVLGVVVPPPPLPIA